MLMEKTLFAWLGRTDIKAALGEAEAGKVIAEGHGEWAVRMRAEMYD